jgi:hypothetical protein
VFCSAAQIDSFKNTANLKKLFGIHVFRRLQGLVKPLLKSRARSPHAFGAIAAHPNIASPFGDRIINTATSAYSSASSASASASASSVNLGGLSRNNGHTNGGGGSVRVSLAGGGGALSPLSAMRCRASDLMPRGV